MKDVSIFLGINLKYGERFVKGEKVEVEKKKKTTKRKSTKKVSSKKATKSKNRMNDIDN